LIKKRSRSKRKKPSKKHRDGYTGERAKRLRKEAKEYYEAKDKKCYRYRSMNGSKSSTKGCTVKTDLKKNLKDWIKKRCRISPSKKEGDTN
jgi:hypothetical protein